MIKFLFYIFPFVLTCIPGITVGSLKFQAYDIFSFCILFFVISPNKNTVNTKYAFIKKRWLYFSGMIMLSTFLSQIFWDATDCMSSYMKGIRFFFPLLICSFIEKYGKIVNIDILKKCCFASTIICPIIGIYGYIYQIPWLTAVQDTILNGNLIIRAGSFWQDSGIYGFICSYFAVVAIYILSCRWKSTNYKTRFAVLSSLFLNILGVVVAFSRMGGLVLIIGLLFILWKYGKRKSVFKILLSFIIISLSLVLYVYYNNIYPALNQNIDKLLSLSSINSTNVATISSSRSIIWEKILSEFIEGPVLCMILGYGYKTSIFWNMADNGYIYVLISTGIVGVCIFISFFMRMHFFLKKTANNIFVDLASILFVGWSLAMLFADVFTYVPTNIMLLTLPALGILVDSRKKEQI